MIDQLAVLIGEWSIDSNKLAGSGRATVEAFEDGKFVRLRSPEEQGKFPSSTWLIGGDDSTDECTCLYFDSRGVRRVYHMSVDGGVWKIWRNAPGFNQRYSGTITDGGKTIIGQWEFSKNGMDWEVDFDLSYRRLNA
jgi:hypothetical protein